MTPEQKIKYLILAQAADWDGINPPVYAGDSIDELYEDLKDCGDHWDALEEVRAMGIETGLSKELSRHYERDAVAAQLPDGSWVGWTYWYGGGKHGEPAAIEWMSKAYHVNCTEKEELVITRKFTL